MEVYIKLSRILFLILLFNSCINEDNKQFFISKEIEILIDSICKSKKSNFKNDCKIVSIEFFNSFNDTLISIRTDCFFENRNKMKYYETKKGIKICYIGYDDKIANEFIVLDSIINYSYENCDSVENHFYDPIYPNSFYKKKGNRLLPHTLDSMQEKSYLDIMFEHGMFIAPPPPPFE